MNYTSNGESLIRRVELRDGTFTESAIKGLPVHNQPITPDDYDIAWLKSKEQPTVPKWRGEIRMVDLFSGTGPMTLGIVEAGRAMGINVVPVFAIDFEINAAMNYACNFPKCDVVNDDILKYINGELGEPITQAETDTLNVEGRVDMVIGGPPCQGHSDLNNHTRRNDPRNQLNYRVDSVEIVDMKDILQKELDELKSSGKTSKYRGFDKSIRICLKLSEYKPLDKPFTYGLDRNAAIGVALTREQFKEYCKSSQ